MIVTEDVARQFIEQVPFHKFLGVQLLEIKDGYCKMRFPFREEVIGDFRFRRWHGGVIATALDSVGGAAAMTTLTSYKDKLATIDIRVDYLRGTGPSELIVEGFLVRNGKSVISCRMQAWQEDQQKLVAEGRAMFSVYRMEEREG